MKILEGLREVIYNFTHPIEDANAPAVEISSDNFVAIARKDGISAEAISELLKNRNGIELVTKKKSKSEKTVTENIEKQNQGKAIKRSDNEIER